MWLNISSMSATSSFSTLTVPTIDAPASLSCSILAMNWIVSPGRTSRWKVALPILARMTFSAKFRASPTRMPEVWAMPSMIRLCGTIGNAGYRSCRCSSASVTFLIAVALVLEVNSVNLSIQIHRTSRDLELVVDVVDDRIDGELHLLDIVARLQRGQVGVRQALLELSQSVGGDFAVVDVLLVVED